jgi:guanylate cyclase soluble subunit beta
VGAAAEVIGLDPATILEMFGEQFLVWCKESGYAKTLQLLGRSLQDFLTNLDALHDHLSIIYPQMDAPSFRCTGEGSQFYLHYYSNRDGLESIVKGIVKAVAREFYGVEVSMSVIKSKGNSEDHSCFLIKEIAYYSDLKHNNPANYVNSASSNQLISPESFCKCFPFHIIFGRNMNVLQVGSSLANLVSGWDESDKNLTTFFALERPRMKLTFANILAHINTIFILRMTMMLQQSNSSGDLANNQPMRLRGQMIYLPESDSVLFVCSPRVSSIYDLDQGGLYLSDIPLHDATRGLLMMSQTAQSEFHHVIQLEEVIGKLNIAQRSLEEEKGRMRDLLHQMLPISVADSLMAGQMVEAERFESVTILFSDIVGFTSICGSCEPIQIVSMLNKLYTMFDQVVGVNGVYKVNYFN